jgi:putative Ca2+/H+ antiporter (TMEM165/GDT1 family)
MLGESSMVNSDAVVGMWNNFLSRRRPVRWTEVWLFVVLGYWMKKNDITG